MNERLKTGTCYWSRFHCLKGAGLHKPMCYELCSESSQSLSCARLPSWPLNGSHTETNLMRKVLEWDLPEQNKLSVAKESRDREGRRARTTRQVGCYSVNTAFSQNDPEDQEIQIAWRDRMSWQHGRGFSSITNTHSLINYSRFTFSQFYNYHEQTNKQTNK